MTQDTRHWIEILSDGPPRLRAPVNGPPVNGAPVNGSARPRMVRRFVPLLVALVIALIAGTLTYEVSARVAPTYRSSAELRVTVNGASGLGTDSLTAANDLTAQLVQVASTSVVLQRPAADVGMSASTLASSISVGSVSQQNLLAISAEAPSALAAQKRAVAVVNGLMAFVAEDIARANATFSRPLDIRISRLGRILDTIAKQLRRPQGTGAQFVLQAQYTNVVSEQQSLRTQLAERVASGRPSIVAVDRAGLGVKVAPRPTLYAIVGAVVAGFVALQLLVLRRRTRI